MVKFICTCISVLFMTACAGTGGAPAAPVEKAPWETASSAEKAKMAPFDCVETTELMRGVLGWPVTDTVEDFKVEGVHIPLDMIIYAEPAQPGQGRQGHSTVGVLTRHNDKVAVAGFYPPVDASFMFVDYFSLLADLNRSVGMDEYVKIATGKYFCLITF